ncbi:TetR/AcrR family transcriptional regulator [Parvibacter caecicola]|uniref:TetR/AcrR family transcriptional regulator n=1 Tax=Parvibacter caecicola TaxID=747645 RepID=A0A3N0ACH4_9ACTN|nr:TetR/AcrR family transcriptional regulator [Parvibacter caecicola]TJW11270.1 TetR/AcrR family transcriptional regulator [Parvibacter caecicola]
MATSQHFASSLAEAISAPRPPRKSLRESRRLTGTRGAIVAAARQLFERQGVARTTVAAIAKAANVTRELVYYHFGSKQRVICAVVDDYVEDLVETVIVWNESRAFGDTAGSLRKCIRLFRYALYDASGRPRPMIAVLEELGIRDAFDVRATRETAECLSSHIAAEYAAFHEVEIELVFEMFCLVIFGMVGLVKVQPGIPDEALMKVVEQTLRLDMVPLEAPSEASAASR